MNITHKGLTYLPWSGHLWCRIIPPKNSLGTPSLQQKGCSGPCAHPPAALLPAIPGMHRVHLPARCRVTFPARRCRPCLGAFCSCCRQKERSCGRGAAWPHRRSLGLSHLPAPSSDNTGLCSSLLRIHIPAGNVSRRCWRVVPQLSSVTGSPSVPSFIVARQ